MPDYIPTNAASSGVALDRKRLKSIAHRTDKPGLIYLAQWVCGLAVTGALVALGLGTPWVWPAMAVHGILLTVPAYALSHETAHGTAFRTRWLNETVLWVTSLIYMEEPLHRRYTHTNHHTFTWHVGKDSQMPFDTPMTLAGWVTEITGFGLLRFHLMAMWQVALGRPSRILRDVTPAGELPKMIRNARIFIAIYALIAGLVLAGVYAPLWFVVLPRLFGAPVMLLFTLTQHVELEENHPSILHSTRSFRASWLGRFLYLNMNHHVEHHLYPQVPFHALPALSIAVQDQVPPPDPGFFRFNFEVLRVVTRRTLGLNTRARGIRQAAHMVTEGAYQPVARRSM
jgi:fatty acid desaturase